MKKIILIGGILTLLFTSCEYWSTIEIRNELDGQIDMAISMVDDQGRSRFKDTIVDCIGYNDCRFTLFKSDDEDEICRLNFCDSLKIGLQNEFIFKIPPAHTLSYVGYMNENPLSILSRISKIEASYKSGEVSAENNGVSQLFSVSEDSYFLQRKRVWIFK